MSDRSTAQEPAQRASSNPRIEQHSSDLNTSTIPVNISIAHGTNRTPSESEYLDSTLLGYQLSHEDTKRDSAIASSAESGRTVSMDDDTHEEESGAKIPRITLNREDDMGQGEKEMRQLRAATKTHASRERPATARHDSRAQVRGEESIVRPSTAGHFRGISTIIPSSSLEELSSLRNLRFSNRGTLLLDDEEADTVLKSTGLSEIPAKPASQFSGEATAETSSKTHVEEPTKTPNTRRKPSTHRLEQLDNPSSRFLSADDVMLSQRVRSMYEAGSENATGRPRSAVPLPGDALQNATLSWGAKGPLQRPISRASTPFPREEYETAGGIEDWEDLHGEDVDRYGFILPVQAETYDASKTSSASRPKGQRISSSLWLASQTPRQRRTIRRSPSNTVSSRSKTTQNTAVRRRPSKKSSRPASSMLSGQTGSSRQSSQSRYRIATNKLPHNRRRRIIDEAGDMLTLPPGLPGIGEEGENDQTTYKLKSREWSREEKWRKMAKPIQTGPKGGGMTFDFDTRNLKLISRTWKGVPDKWRASAWHAFLSASATRRRIGEKDEELIKKYYELQEEDSADDVQIDTDVPRTISDHVMFRKRYRGGQRLLFRVLHAISLYFPDTGYVQGMASIAAMLLNYYDEEQAFVMLVRVWQLRGLEALYRTGFEGLMSTLETFEKRWLAGGDVARKLDELGIASTAYATRWYLTIFNISIPFPAQLRVWDVFLLLGDTPNATSAPTTASSDTEKLGFGDADLDVLHATSMALIDATREILLDSDFENVMKTLTSQIPVRDEDILMRVAKTEWKAKKKRAT